jgi:endonuclease/exonuclease/phosphatase family metal-dependent hydrolase
MSDNITALKLSINNYFEKLKNLLETINNNSSEKSLKIITINIENNNKIKKQDNKDKFILLLKQYNADLICFQESNDDNIIELQNIGYTLIYKNDKSGKGEKIHIYLNNNSNGYITITKTETIETNKCYTSRLDCIIELLFYNTRYIKIGILHLCGGRFDEPQLQKINEDGVKEIKTEQIKKIISEKVDIILGDFNSDVYYYLTDDINKKQEEFLLKNKLNRNIIDIWNKSPFELLEQTDYKLACGEKNDVDACVEFYKKNYTSFYETSPDAIFYKNNKDINVSKFEIIDLLGPKLSDHNGLIANFDIKI